MVGKIIKIDSSISTVITKENTLYDVFIKGNVKKQTRPLVGDNVEFEIIDNNQGNIVDILPRKNEIYRPSIANVDQVVIVTALYEPLFASYILNKYIMMSEAKQILPILLFTKIELLATKKEYQEVYLKLQQYQQLGFKVIILDNMNKAKYKPELDQLTDLLANHVSYFTGQTGAGKSTTLNNFLVDEIIKTNEISLKLNRGKHTTTNVKIYHLNNNILIADTPGFSSFELKDIEVEDILSSFSVFKPFANQCKFLNCAHIFENKCGVKNAIEQNKIPHFIYNDYKKVYDEIKTRKVRY